MFFHVLFTFLMLYSIIEAEPTIYQVLKSHGLPSGLLPKGVKNFTLDNSGKFVVYLDEACNAKFENELHYEKNVSGTLSYGEMDDLSGISAKDLFLWFKVKKIKVDMPSSGVIHFEVDVPSSGVVSKQFSLSSFDNPRECIAGQISDLQTVSKGLSRKIQYKHDDKGNFENAAL